MASGNADLFLTSMISVAIDTLASQKVAVIEKYIKLGPNGDYVAKEDIPANTLEILYRAQWRSKCLSKFIIPCNGGCWTVQ